ncbi:hypothetical protein KUCAC02_027784 [Chaenocephalus aceratus]|nr:hypothetical protein KUCAC02_027784 [Chaenocephalus aceratus]
MFPDSEIAKKFACGKDKTGYTVRFGLAPYFKEQLVNSINKAGPFVLMFDESLNQATKKKQMDVHIRYWDDGCVRARYLGSQFLGHGRAEDLLHHIKECGAQLKTRQLMSVSTDGPNVNFKLVNLLQKEHAELDGGAQLVLVGSCGLHTLHNAVQAGFTMWQLERLLRAMHYLFHNVPARREDFTSLTGSSCFPRPFCGHRWVENVRVAERAVEMWPMLQKYVDGVKNKKIRHPAAASYERQHKGIHSSTFSPFLLTFQTDEPVMPFLAKDLAELLKALVLNLSSRHFRAHQGAEQVSFLCSRSGKSARRAWLQWSRKCRRKAPQMSSRQAQCMFGSHKHEQGSRVGHRKEEECSDVIVQQSERFLCVEGRGEGFLSFQPFEQRLDVFLHEALGTP